MMIYWMIRLVGRNEVLFFMAEISDKCGVYLENYTAGSPAVQATTPQINHPRKDSPISARLKLSVTCSGNITLGWTGRGDWLLFRGGFN